MAVKKKGMPWPEKYVDKFNKYTKEHYDKTTFTCPKGNLAVYREAARLGGYFSFSDYVRTLIENDIEKHQYDLKYSHVNNNHIS